MQQNLFADDDSYSEMTRIDEVSEVPYQYAQQTVQNEKKEQTVQNEKKDLAFTSEYFLKDLNIIQTAYHPSLIIKNYNGKEAYTLYNLFDFTVMQKGSKYLKQLFRTPLKDEEKILYRQHSITVVFNLNDAF